MTTTVTVGVVGTETATTIPTETTVDVVDSRRAVTTITAVGGRVGDIVISKKRVILMDNIYYYYYYCCFAIMCV